MARPKSTCSVDGCEKSCHGNGLCDMHYRRVERRGTTELPAAYGRSTTPEYQAWQSMKARCQVSSHAAYTNYGGRGIEVCATWQDFGAFLDDMGPRPSSDHSLDRIDNDGPYSPENCRWATWVQQNRNNRGNHLVTAHGQTMTVTEWAEQLGMDRFVIYNRLHDGWPVEKALDPRRYSTSGKPA